MVYAAHINVYTGDDRSEFLIATDGLGFADRPAAIRAAEKIAGHVVDLDALVPGWYNATGPEFWARHDARMHVATRVEIIDGDFDPTEGVHAMDADVILIDMRDVYPA